LSSRLSPGDFSAVCSRGLGVFATHGATALAPTAGSYVRLAFALLLIGVTVRFLALRALEVFPILAFALVFRGASLLQGNGKCLPRQLLAADSSLCLPYRGTAPELAVLELKHDASGRFFCPR